MSSFNPAKQLAYQYTKVSLNEKQAQMKEKLSSKRRRGKRDKSDEEEGLADVEELSGFNAEDVLWKAGCVLASIFTIGTNIFAATAFGAAPVNLASAIVAIPTSVAVAYREVVIEDIKNVRDANNAMRDMIWEMSLENERKREKMEDLSAQVLCGEMAKERLVELTGGQNLKVDKLRTLMATHREVMKQKRFLIKRGLQAEVIRLLMKCDADNSGNLDKKERRRFMNYLRNLPAIQMDEERVFELIKRKDDVWELISIIKNCPDKTEELSDEHPIVIDFESNELPGVMEEKAELREAAKNLTRQLHSPRTTSKKSTIPKKTVSEARSAPGRYRKKRPSSLTRASIRRGGLQRDKAFSPGETAAQGGVAGRRLRKKRSSSLTRDLRRPTLQRDLAFSPGESAGNQGKKLREVGKPKAKSAPPKRLPSF